MAAARQYIVDGILVNETKTRQYIVDGILINEIIGVDPPAPPAGALAGTLSLLGVGK